MSDQAAGGAFYAPQRWSLWRWLGFGECHVPAPEDTPGLAPGRMIVDVGVRFGLRDRLRILLSGKVMVEASVQTDVVVARSRAVAAFSVLPPGYPVPRP